MIIRMLLWLRKTMTKVKKKKSRNWLLTVVALIIFYTAVLLIGSPFIKSSIINYRSYSYSYMVNSDLPKVIPQIESISPPTFEDAIKSKEPVSEGVIGEVIMDRIGVNLPIFVGVTNQNLLFGTATLYPERDPLIDNIVILGHHLGYQGQLFSPLLQAVKGDEVEMRYLGEVYKYQVTTTAIIKENNLSVLENTTDDKGVITLVTCDVPTETDQRFIVKAKLMTTTNKNIKNIEGTTVKSDNENQISQSIVQKKVVDWHQYLPIIIILISLIVGTPLLIRLSK